MDFTFQAAIRKVDYREITLIGVFTERKKKLRVLIQSALITNVICEIELAAFVLDAWKTYNKIWLQRLHVMRLLNDISTFRKWSTGIF